MDRTLFKKVIDIIDEQLGLENSLNFDIDPADYKDINKVDIVRVLSYLRSKKAIAFKSIIRKKVTSSLLAFLSDYEVINVLVHKTAYEELVKNELEEFSELSYRYNNGQMILYINKHSVGEIIFNAETSSFYETALKNPYKDISYSFMQHHGSRTKPFNQNYNNHRLYSTILKYFFVKSNKIVVSMSDSVQINQSQAAKIVDALN